MMGNINCGSCRYWEDFGDGQNLGQCRLYPPQVFAMLGKHRAGNLSVTNSTLVYEYPEVFRKGWCGQHASGKNRTD